MPAGVEDDCRVGRVWLQQVGWNMTAGWGGVRLAACWGGGWPLGGEGRVWLQAEGVELGGIWPLGGDWRGLRFVASSVSAYQRWNKFQELKIYQTTFFYCAFEKEGRMSLATRWGRREKCWISTVVSHDTSINQHDAIEGTTSYYYYIYLQPKVGLHLLV